MRFIYACFKGYIGFKNGMGLDKVEIDFTKCHSKIIMIQGKNGCGKSTLSNSLNVFPDPASCFTSNIDGEKILSLINDGDRYDIRIISPVDNKGNRKQSKAFIRKNGLELNENGNITSYKDIIYSEFDLDANYASLISLSSDDKGLGSKTPSERKKYVGSIINNLEVYNNIYKTLNKKSLIFKSHINTLHTKILNIGDKSNLEMTLKALQQKSDILNSSILSLNNKIVELQTRSSINQEEASQLQDLKLKESSLIEQLLIINKDISLLEKRIQVGKDNISNKYEQDSALREQYIRDKEELITEWKIESEKLNSINRSINELQANIEMYSSDIDTTIKDKYSSSVASIIDITERIKANNIEANTDNIYLLVKLIDFYNTFIRKIDIFYDNCDTKTLEYIALRFNSTDGITLKSKLDSYLLEIEDIKNKMIEMKERLRSIAVLEDRPSNCKIDTCPFISNALDIKKSFGDSKVIESELIKMNKRSIELSNEISNLQSMIEDFNYCERKNMELGAIISDINTNHELFVIFGDNILASEDKFRKAIAISSPFNFQRDPRRLIDALNDLKMLQSEQQTFTLLKKQYEFMESSIKLIDSNKSSIERMNLELDTIHNKVIKYKQDIDKYTELIDSLNSNIGLEKQFVDAVARYDLVSNDIKTIQSKIEDIESKSSDSIKNFNLINNMKNEIDQYNIELKPVVSDIQRISGQLTLLDSYYQEYELYNTKYNMIETIKKYCSPTGGGIQSIFMQLYMDKTLQIANDILGMLFGGEYRLLDFVINSDEFRIPFIGSGLPVNDISYGSCSQVAIMGVAINLALFYQASTKYNIAKFDEVSSSLDTANKYEFVNVIWKCINLLRLEQVFMISHDMEIDSSTVDIIRLKPNDNEFDNVQLGNVIWDYTEEIKKTS